MGGGGGGPREVCLELFFQKEINELYHSSFFLVCFMCCSFTCDTERTFVSLQFACPLTQNSFNLVKEWGKYWKVFDDRYLFGDDDCTLHSQTGHERAHYHLTEQTLNLPWNGLILPILLGMIPSSQP
jgi:hypothetical protein